MPPEEERKQLDYYRRLARQTQVIRITQAVNQLHQNRREALLVTPDEFSLLALTPQVDWNFLYEQAGVSKEVFFARAAQGIETDITFAHASSILIEVIDAVRPEIQWEREIALSRAPFIADEFQRVTQYIFKDSPQLVADAIESGRQQGISLLLRHLAKPDTPLRSSLPFGVAQAEGMTLTPSIDQRGQIGYVPTKVEGIALKYAWANTQPATFPRLSLRTRPL